MITRNKVLLMLCLCSWIMGCHFEDEYHSPIPESEQKIIRRILNANGYDLSDNDLVDSYIGKVTDYHSGYWYGKYDLIIPKGGYNRITLTDDINNLTKYYFEGYISTPYTITIDTIIIETDSFIYIPSRLSLGGKISTIPQNINKIRTRFLNVRNNQLTTLPEEIMELTSPPFPYDTFGINISGNQIDTSLLSDTLRGWLRRYSTYATGIAEKTY